MKHDLALLKVDIRDEFQKLERLHHEFNQLKSSWEPSGESISMMERAAIGYDLHNFYNGCENIFLTIARYFENKLTTDTWHRDLLKQMKLNIPEYRPAVIDDELAALLEDFRSFRHKFRHSYTFELDWEKERLVALKFNRTFEMLRDQVNIFLKQLDTLAE